ncbi:hypothetical protein [Pseudonocardia humida]|uniref:Uncharacterized protein n=1 Tax=Pseudonocardia humida TaxID=2800819 RepID=A0ABT0ZTE4_9PSEU|nr:hypothetical protein [Pseudonocardia humida]MCO1653989.1 hypothetical protein [Pseudonocardia humida]
MSGVFGQRVVLSQGRGPDVELRVTGTALYATYETLDGYPAVYDPYRELFCFARLSPEGAFLSTRVSVLSPPPPGLRRHVHEADHVRAAKIAALTRR